jgi:hypothetical protein
MKDEYNTNNPSSQQFLDWQKVVKKEARGQNDLDLGEVQEIGSTFVKTEKGHGKHEFFYIPKYLVQNFDGHTLHFNVNQGQVEQFKRDKPPTDMEYRNQYGGQVSSDVETRVPYFTGSRPITGGTNTGVYQPGQRPSQFTEDTSSSVSTSPRVTRSTTTTTTEEDEEE